MRKQGSGGVQILTLVSSFVELPLTIFITVILTKYGEITLNGIKGGTTSKNKARD